MTFALPLDLVLGPEQTAALLSKRANDLTQQDCLPPNRALRLACERGLAGDPAILAEPGQVWARNHTDEDKAPARQLTITGRLTCPPRVCATSDDGIEYELPLEALTMYQLHGTTETT